MQVPKLPSNPMTITPEVPRTPQFYKSISEDEISDLIRDHAARDFERLLAFDTYHRSTSPEREELKNEIKAVLSKGCRNDFGIIDLDINNLKA